MSLSCLMNINKIFALSPFLQSRRRIHGSIWFTRAKWRRSFAGNLSDGYCYSRCCQILSDKTQTRVAVENSNWNTQWTSLCWGKSEELRRKIQFPRFANFIVHRSLDQRCLIIAFSGIQWIQLAEWKTLPYVRTLQQLNKNYQRYK